MIAELSELTPEWIKSVLSDIGTALRDARRNEGVVYYEADYASSGIVKINIVIYPPSKVKFAKPQKYG